MNSEQRKDLSDIPLEVLIEEVESRKSAEIEILVSQINSSLKKLKILVGNSPYNKFLQDEDGDRWEILEFFVQKREDKIIDVYYLDKRIDKE